MELNLMDDTAAGPSPGVPGRQTALVAAKTKVVCAWQWKISWTFNQRYFNVQIWYYTIERERIIYINIYLSKYSMREVVDHRDAPHTQKKNLIHTFMDDYCLAEDGVVRIEEAGHAVRQVQLNGTWGGNF